MSSQRPPVCALISGGLDSAVLLRRFLHAGVPVLPLYVCQGLRWETAELYWLRRLLSAMRVPHLKPLRVVDMPARSLYGRHWSLGHAPVPSSRSADSAVYLPGRNLLLISAAAIVCARERIERIALGILQGNPFGDATPEFFHTLSQCLQLALGQPIRILTPLRSLNKLDSVRAANKLPIGLTFSCLSPRGVHPCGRCNKCAERARALHAPRAS